MRWRNRVDWNPLPGFVLCLVALHAAGVPPAEAQGFEYRVLATNRTSTMEQEMNEAADLGFRVGAVMGGETAFGGREAVVIMQRQAGDGATPNRYEYRLLATNRTSTMQEEVQAAGDVGFEYIGQTIFRSRFGGQEVVVVLERDSQADRPQYEYLLLATSRTSTMQEELQDAGADDFALVGMTINRTAFGGNEVVAILRRVREE